MLIPTSFSLLLGYDTLARSTQDKDRYSSSYSNIGATRTGQYRETNISSADARVEQERLCRIIEQTLELELARPPFTVVATEKSTALYAQWHIAAYASRSYR